MKKVLRKLKSNKGFTMQDVIVAIVILVLFVGVIGGSYISIYKIQCQTKLNSAATLYAIQILENIDKISYDEVTNGMESNYRTAYGIPDIMDLSIQVSQYNTDNTIKNVKLTISYKIQNDTETIILDRIKVKEI